MIPESYALPTAEDLQTFEWEKHPGTFLDILFSVWISGHWSSAYLKNFERFSWVESDDDPVDHPLLLQYFAMCNLFLSKVPSDKDVAHIMVSGEIVMTYLLSRVRLTVVRSGELSFLYYLIQALHGSRDVIDITSRIQTLLQTYIDEIVRRPALLPTEKFGYMLTHISFVCTRWGRDPPLLARRYCDYIIDSILEVRTMIRKKHAEPQVLRVEFELALDYLGHIPTETGNPLALQALEILFATVPQPDLHARMVANEMYSRLLLRRNMGAPNRRL